jgi:hypothetical protein
MGIDLGSRKITWAGSDMTWIGSEEGTRSNVSVTLDLSKFDFATVFTNLVIPSGTVLGKVSASGLYGPYNDTLNTGVEVAKGHLFTDVDVKQIVEIVHGTTLTGSVLAAMLIRGVVIEAKLPTNHGLDANGKTDLKFVQYR